jgi:hypothetical protein
MPEDMSGRVPSSIAIAMNMSRTIAIAVHSVGIRRRSRLTADILETFANGPAKMAQPARKANARALYFNPFFGWVVATLHRAC